MQNSCKKKVLLIAPLFFGYYKEIIKELQILNYDATYVCDTSSNTNISKAIGRLNKNFIKSFTHKYFKEKVIPEIQGIEYDYVLVVAGMTFSFDEEILSQLKEMNPKAKFIIYQWDSERNLPYVVKIHKYFDKIYSFDSDDAKIEKYNFLPLFYIRDYENVGLKTGEKFKYDCSYVGTAHPQKYKYINQMTAALKGIMDNQKIYHYMPSKLKFVYHKILDKEFKETKLSDLETTKLSTEEVLNIFSESKCILDAPQKGQTGLTIRTIECLGAKKKLITTNSDIKSYDFYKEENIYVYDGEFDFNNPFFNSDYIELDKEIYEKYSLRSWINTLLN